MQFAGVSEVKNIVYKIEKYFMRNELIILKLKFKQTKRAMFA